MKEQKRMVVTGRRTTEHCLCFRT